MSKQELLPPQRTIPSRSTSTNVSPYVPNRPSRGFVESAYTRWSANSNTRAVDALARLDIAEAGRLNAQTQVIESLMRTREALCRFQELPERLGHELAMRRVERADSYMQALHMAEANKLRRMKEIALLDAEALHAQATRTHARTVLTDAEQQLEAQRAHGALTYEIAHKKKNLELLDIELSEQERRALMSKQLGELEEQNDEAAAADEIDDALYARREQLNAGGLDTRRIDQLIQSRR